MHLSFLSMYAIRILGFQPLASCLICEDNQNYMQNIVPVCRKTLHLLRLSHSVKNAAFGP